MVHLVLFGSTFVSIDLAAIITTQYVINIWSILLLLLWTMSQPLIHQGIPYLGWLKNLSKCWLCSSLELHLGCWSLQYLIVCLLTSNSYGHLLWHVRHLIRKKIPKINNYMCTQVSSTCLLRVTCNQTQNSLPINRPSAFRVSCFPLSCVCLCYSQCFSIYLI